MAAKKEVQAESAQPEKSEAEKALDERLKKLEEASFASTKPSSSDKENKGNSKGIAFAVVGVLIGIAIIAILAFANWPSDRIADRTAETSSQAEVAKLRKEIEALKAKRGDPDFVPPPPPPAPGPAYAADPYGAQPPPPGYRGFGGPRHHYYGGPPKRVHREVIPICSQGGTYVPGVGKCLRQRYIKTP